VNRFSIQGFGHRGEAADIGEQHCHLFALAVRMRLIQRLQPAMNPGQRRIYSNIAQNRALRFQYSDGSFKLFAF